LELSYAVENLHAQVDNIQQKIDELVSSLFFSALSSEQMPPSCTEKISSALRQKRKAIAMSNLRSKKQLEDLLMKRLGSLEILQSTLIRVEGAAGDVEVRRLPLTRKYIFVNPCIDNEILRVVNINPPHDPRASIITA
jgi:charged multivesicular body protein 7